MLIILFSVYTGGLLLFGRLRITGGYLLHRSFCVPNQVDFEMVRPTPDRIRESVFFALRYQIKRAFILDLCSGSGAHAFEALSRGAKYVIMIEKNYKVVKCIKKNVTCLKLNNCCKIIIADYARFVSKKNQYYYDVVFIDPPYKLVISCKFWQELLVMLKINSVIVYRYPSDIVFYLPRGYRLIKKREYGSSCVVFLMPNLKHLI